ncbi:small membrane protein [Actinobacteria bacterium OK074]|nr:small membrane protein [Actinobacteria bacterium OK074]
MALSISAVVLLAIIVFLLVKKSGLKGGHAVVCILLGFYLASSTVAPTISDLTTNFADMISTLKF